MKKFLVMAFLLLGGAVFTTASADGPKEIPLNIINEGPIGNDSTKGPIGSLFITQDDNILTLPVTFVDYSLELRNENGMVVYSAYIPAGTTQIILPTTLSGDFEIRLVASTYYYIGYISL